MLTTSSETPDCRVQKTPSEAGMEPQTFLVHGRHCSPHQHLWTFRALRYESTQRSYIKQTITPFSP